MVRIFIFMPANDGDVRMKKYFDVQVNYTTGEAEAVAGMSPRYQPAFSQVPLNHHHHGNRSHHHHHHSKLLLVTTVTVTILHRETTYVAGWGITKTKLIHGSKIQVKVQGCPS